jgi:CO/xanthine dehydrogenase Mo-binding subunit
MIDRRQFFQALGGGLAIVITRQEAPAQQQSLPQEVDAWLHIGKDGAITVSTGKVEMGQGARTELTQVVAEELRAPAASITLVMGDTDLTPFDAGTFGSQTTPRMVPQLRKAAATAREMLLDLAAEKWGVDRAALAVSGGKVADPKTGRSAGFGELTEGRKLLKTISDSVPLTPPEQWKVAGIPLAKVNARNIVTGRHRYPYDVTRPGMLHGKVLRPAAFGATLVSLESSAAEAMEGVKVVRDGDFAAVAAPTPQAAERAVAALKAEWKTTPQPARAELFDYLKKNAQGRANPNERGSVEKALAEADTRLRETYTVAYIAHAPLEPRAAVAEWNDGKLTVWTGTQRPFGVRNELMAAFSLPQDHVRVLMPDTGSGYGGKHMGDAAIEAARMARAAGKPVKVVWTRQEEFAWAYFRPAGVIEVASGLRKDGSITAWEFTNYNSGGAGLQIAYDIPNYRIAFQPSRSPLRQGSYRALAATANHFARETHIDELAHAAGMDPLEFRLKNTQDPRFRAVLEAAAARFGWGRTKPASGRGYGIAAGWEKGGYVATCVEIAARPGANLQIERVVEAFECGAIINPDNLKNQIEGAIIMGLGGALFEAIDFADGRILNGRFSRYRAPRFSDVPPIETVMLDRKDLPSVGAGECPIVAIAPAIGNAIFAATGTRLRSLPLAPKGSV